MIKKRNNLTLMRSLENEINVRLEKNCSDCPWTRGGAVISIVEGSWFESPCLGGFLLQSKDPIDLPCECEW